MIKSIIENLKVVVAELEGMENSSVANNGVRIGDLSRGDKFENVIGKFIVLENDKEQGWVKVQQDCFYESDVVFDSDSCNYIESDLKDKFDGEITDKYMEVFGDALVEHEVNLKSVDMQDYGSFTCKVRPITFDEARQYNDLLVKEDIGDWWWTCTPWSTEKRGWEYSVSVVSPSGRIGSNVCCNCRGVRPFCILKSDLFVSCVEE